MKMLAQSFKYFEQFYSQIYQLYVLLERWNWVFAEPFLRRAQLSSLSTRPRSRLNTCA